MSKKQYITAEDFKGIRMPRWTNGRKEFVVDVLLVDEAVNLINRICAERLRSKESESRDIHKRLNEGKITKEEAVKLWNELGGQSW
jgi:hypothetical protein